MKFNKYIATLGIIASIIQGSTDTTIYVIGMYFSSVGIKKIRYVLIAALIGDLIGMITSVVIWRIMS